MMKPAEDMDEELEEEGGEQDAVYDQIYDGMPVTCGGIIVDKNKKLGKDGREFAFLKIEDLYGTFEVSLFGNVYPRFKNIVDEDALVTVKGKISLRNSSPSVNAQEIIPWKKRGEQVKEDNGATKLYLRFDTKDIDIYNKVCSSLNAYPGEAEVIIKCTSYNKAFMYNAKVELNNYLLNELYGIIGYDNVKTNQVKKENA